MNKFIIETLVWIALNGARSAQAKQVLMLIAQHFNMTRTVETTVARSAWFGIKQWTDVVASVQPDYSRLTQHDLDLRELTVQFHDLCRQPSAIEFAVAKMEGYKLDNDGFYYTLLFSDIQSSFWRAKASEIIESTGFDKIEEMHGSEKAVDEALVFNGYLQSLTGVEVPLARQPNAVGVWEDVTSDKLDNYLVWRCQGLIASRAERAENTRTMH